VVAAAGHAGSTPQGAHHRRFQLGGGCSRTCRQHPQGACHRRLQLRWWPLLDMPAAPPRGPIIDVFNFGGGRSRTYRQHPPRGQLSTSLTSVVVAVGLAASTPQKARHRRLQLRWWPLPGMPAAPLRGPAIDVFNFGGGRCRTCRQHPPRGPSSTSSTLVVAAVGPAASTPQGARHPRLQLLDLQLQHLPGIRRQHVS
jgi:hypothetical protein